MLPEQAFHGGNQFGAGAGFAYKTMRAEEPDRGFHLGRRLLHSQENNFRGRGHLANLKGGLDAVHHRHTDVQKDEFRMEHFHAIERLLAVFRLATNGEGVRVQELAHAVAGNVMIVNEEDASRKSPRNRRKDAGHGRLCGTAIPYGISCSCAKLRRTNAEL